MSDIVERLRHPASVFYEYAADNGALLEQAADEIERLRKNFATAEHEMKVVDQNRIFLQKENERWMNMIQELNGYTIKLEEAIFNYVNTVIYCEGVTFIDGVDDEWAKLIIKVWTEGHKVKGRDGNE